MELSKNYEPVAIENKWYSHWLDKQYFNSVPDEREPYTIVIPPPNVTGVLHMGHCLNNSIQDILIRRARMQGKNACWVPGTDHASIATEAKVVAMLRERGITKSSLSRDEFLGYAWEWKEKYGGIILEQLKKLGCSLDWNRTSFTMDPAYYESIIKVFVSLYEKGVIYRGKRMINWDVKALTALSDEEVIRKETKQQLYFLKYKIDDRLQMTDDSRRDDGSQLTNDSTGTSNNYQLSPDNYSKEDSLQMSDDSGQMKDDSTGTSVNYQLSTVNYITIATVRPETIMGDTAIAVHPDDERYKHLHGKFAIVPLINRRIPIITDEYVTMEFGTGALKVTPAHDMNDNQLGQKHGLEVIDIFNDDGTLGTDAQIYIGEDRFVARKKIVAELEEKGFLLKKEDYTSEVGYSERTDSVVEPRLSLQWWVSMKDIATPALKSVLDEEIAFYPPKFKNLYRQWMENIKDWCISRQLWWGHRIPAWYDGEGNFVVAENEADAIEKFKIQNPNTKTESIHQDEDCLDTWFSSWLWPFEVFKGFSDPGNAEAKYYYPTNTLVTAPEIIFFWVARMIMAGYEYMGEKPFNAVYFTGIVRDKQGRKMSKSLGNSPDMLALIDQYGADAVRFGIMVASPAGNDILFDESSLEQGRNFNNKMWNALKLIKMWEGRKVDSGQMIVESGQAAVSSGNEFAVLWFENRLNEVKVSVDEMMNQFRLSEALKTIYSLIWDDFCSWYLEWVKPGFEQPVNAALYEKTIVFFTELMQLLHPFMPFITEEIYHALAERNDDLCVNQYEKIEAADKEILEQGKLLKDTITALRDVRNKQELKPKETIALHIQTTDRNTFGKIESLLAKQLNAKSIDYAGEPVSNTITTVLGKDKFYIETEKPQDTGKQHEEMLKELNHLKGFLLSVEKKLGNEKFVQNAKPEVLAMEQKKKADAETKIKVIEESLGV
ncbi:MAG: valine--tRNA ligase [Ferruginibacter sp.]